MTVLAWKMEHRTRERERAEEREEGREGANDAAGGPVVAYRGYRRAAKASTAPCCPYQILIDRDSERGERGKQSAKKGTKEGSRQPLEIVMAARWRKSSRSLCGFRTRARNTCSSIFLKKDEQ